MRMPRTLTIRAACHLATPHQVGDYPGLLVVAVPGWSQRVIVIDDGQTIEARGGEYAPGYELPDGLRVDELRLSPGDRATRVRALPRHLAEWRVERAAQG